ncbi:hypothetical protein [Gordonia hankookensis]|uniref:Transcriptional regulator, AbiEi antitoxin, Type IV TA system n=1 Tax=Gordonia hankookensis TaxID=589403 RepID=A0ABR7WB01_9ACTN|nr:hypothetical protein [Gordonia hankookensis]MBD1319974.1 hypothetical protein [Gordonia hankookensis]
MIDFPTDRYGLVRRERALARDISDDQLAAAERRGDLVRLAPGVLVPASDEFKGPAGEDTLYRLRSIAVATSERDGRGTALSHGSAAAIHGLATLASDREKVHFTNGLTAGGFVRGLRHVHPGSLHPEEVVVVDGVAVTSLERTAVDVACAGSFAQALTVFDAACRLDADRTLMADILDRRRRGARPARRALPLADALSESVGESWSRAQMIEGELPVPRLQREYRCGDKLYRADYDWDGLLVGEFDGMTKYGRLLRSGESVRDTLMREKRREDDLRAIGVMVIRWTWAVLEKGGLVELLRPWLVRLGLIVA